MRGRIWGLTRAVPHPLGLVVVDRRQSVGVGVGVRGGGTVPCHPLRRHGNSVYEWRVVGQGGKVSLSLHLWTSSHTS